MVWIAIIALLVVLGILVFGVAQFAIGKPDPHRSNKLMQLRVLAQAAALLVVLAALAISAAG